MSDLSHAELEELINNLNVFPGHRFKIINLYNHLKKISNERYQTVRKINTSKNPKRYLSVGSNRSSTGTTVRKPRSVETFRSNNRMVNSLINSGGFGFKYYIGSEEKKNVPEVKKKDEEKKPEDKKVAPKKESKKNIPEVKKEEKKEAKDAKKHNGKEDVKKVKPKSNITFIQSQLLRLKSIKNTKLRKKKAI